MKFPEIKLGNIFGKNKQQVPVNNPVGIGFSPSGPAPEIPNFGATATPTASTEEVIPTAVSPDLGIPRTATDSAAEAALKAVSDQLGDADKTAQAAPASAPIPNLGTIGSSNSDGEMAPNIEHTSPVTNSGSADPNNKAA